MARIIVRRSRLSREYARVLRKAHIAYFFFVAFFLVFLVLSLREFNWWQLSLLLLSAVSFWLGKSTGKDRGIYGQGLRGEKQVLRVLRKLGRDCLVAPNALIGKGKRFEVDAIVCAPGAVSLIEVKHYKGTVERKDGSWSVCKGRHRKKIGNPKEQLAQRVMCATQLLERNGLMGTNVRGVLVFAEDTQVEDALHTRLKREEDRTFFLSQNEAKEMLEYVGAHGKKDITGVRLYEALVGK